jgi:hypothetical protein
VSRVYLTADGLAKCLPNLWPQLEQLRRFEPTGEPWSAIFAARAWANAQGFTLGPQERELPIAVMRPPATPAKWSWLTPEEKAALEGVVYLEDPAAGYMDGAVAIRLRAAPAASPTTTTLARRAGS